jgi:ferredoxin-NADP reductase
VSHSHHEAFLRNVWHTNDRTKHFQFQISNGHRFDFRPGQFISLDIEMDGHKVRRPYSIASAPRNDNGFDLCLNMLPEGRVSSWLFHLKPGDPIGFSGPFGFFTLREPPDPVSAFIATGTGIAPVRAMLQQLYRRPHGSEVWLIFGVRKEGDILYRAEFEKMAEEHKNFHFIPTLSRPDSGWIGHTGYVQRHVVRYLAAKTGLHAYICGLRKMIEDVKQEFRAMGYDRKALSYEKYD